MKREYKEWMITIEEDGAAAGDSASAVPANSASAASGDSASAAPEDSASAAPGNSRNLILLKCPVCGCSLFSEQYVRLDTSLMGMDDYAASYHCQRCGHILWFESGRVKSAAKVPETPVEKWEFRFIDWGYSEKKLRKIVDDKNYEEPARTAAANLLKRTDEKNAR